MGFSRDCKPDSTFGNQSMSSTILKHKEEKIYMLIPIDAEKNLIKYSIIHDRNSQPTKNRREFP